MIIYALIAVGVLGAMWIGTSVRVIKEFERGVVFRFGKVRAVTRGPGLALITPIADRLQKVNMQRSSARATSTTCCPTGNGSTKAWN